MEREDELGGSLRLGFFFILGSLSWLNLGVAAGPIVDLWSLSERGIRPLSVPRLPIPLGQRYGQSVEREAPLQALCLLDVALKKLWTLGHRSIINKINTGMYLWSPPPFKRLTQPRCTLIQYVAYSLSPSPPHLSHLAFRVDDNVHHSVPISSLLPVLALVTSCRVGILRTASLDITYLPPRSSS